MSKIAKRALISSLLASTVIAPALAQRPVVSRRTPGVENARRVCGHDATATVGALSVAASDLLADGVVHGKVMGYLRRACAATREESEDAAQEAAVRALQKEIRSCCEITFAGWMRRTGQNVLFDMRKKRRETRLSAEPDKLDATVGPSRESGPGDMLAIRDELRSVLARHDLATMTADKKARLGMAVGEQLTGGHVTRPTRLIEELAPALRELSRSS
jgi:DNA-directed RNA polymerase specialized sigma24 family protein